MVALAGVATRLPALISSRHLGFDDGVYGASALAMRDGAVPFREIFSSQGPLFLPLVWLADVVGLRTHGAPRLVGVAATIAVTFAVAALGTRLRGRRVGLVAATLVATSGSMLWVTGPLTSDGIATALAALAVAGALAYDDAPSNRRAFATALAIAAALAVKSLLLPAAVPVAVVLLRHRRGSHLALALGTGITVALATSLPFGLGDVWDQSVTYHLEVAGERTPGANLRKMASTLGDRDAPLLAAAALALGAGALGAVRRRRSAAPDLTSQPRVSPGRLRLQLDGERLVWVWWAATVGALVLEHPLWRNHLAHLVAPTAVLAACGVERVVERSKDVSPRGRRVATVAVVGLALVLGGYHVVHTSPLLAPGTDHAGEARDAVRAVEALPSGAWAISDEPGIVWSAGRRTPADLVDTSILRIESGRLTAAGVAREASASRVCAVVVWSRRFDELELGPLLRHSGYALARRFDDVRAIWIRPACRPT